MALWTIRELDAQLDRLHRAWCEHRETCGPCWIDAPCDARAELLGRHALVLSIKHAVARLRGRFARRYPPRRAAPPPRERQNDHTRESASRADAQAIAESEKARWTRTRGGR